MGLSAYPPKRFDGNALLIAFEVIGWQVLLQNHP